jgi:hypothetical protein
LHIIIACLRVKETIFQMEDLLIHIVLHKWMEEKENTRSSRGQSGRTKLASLTQDSCFLAHVEEALKDLENLKQGQHQKLESLEMFEGYVTRMINDHNISSNVFLEGSISWSGGKNGKNTNKINSSNGALLCMK